MSDQEDENEGSDGSNLLPIVFQRSEIIKRVEAPVGLVQVGSAALRHGRFCASCGIPMQPRGMPRIRAGVLACKRCDPTESCDRPRRNAPESAGEILEAADLDALADRPQTWGECVGGTGPCPYVACRHHLYLDVSADTGTIKINFPHIEPEDMQEPCTLRLASAQPQTLEQVAQRLNLTRERVRQIEDACLVKLRKRALRGHS
jgi:hypothetical protein